VKSARVIREGELAPHVVAAVYLARHVRACAPCREALRSGSGAWCEPGGRALAIRYSDAYAKETAR
jgi:hypothetical protein